MKRYNQKKKRERTYTFPFSANSPSRFRSASTFDARWRMRWVTSVGFVSESEPRFGSGFDCAEPLAFGDDDVFGEEEEEEEEEVER